MAVAVCALAVPGPAAAADHVPWATEATLPRALSQQIDVLWSDNPLRSALANLSHTQRVAILIDRRVDPGQRLSLELQGVPVEAALNKIAEQCGLGVSRLGAVVYFGPPAAVERLQPLAAALEKDVRRLPSPAQRKFFQTRAFAWDDLAAPRDLLAELGRQSGLKIGGLERVPHDLWAAADLPPLSLVDRLTLVAVQFDLTFSVAADGAQVDLVPLPESIGKRSEERDRLALPQIASKSSPSRPPTGAPQTLIKQLVVQEKPLGPVLRELAKQLDLDLRMDEQAIQAAGISLDQRVSVRASNVTVDELLRRLLRSTGLTFRRHQNVVEIVPAKK